MEEEASLAQMMDLESLKEKYRRYDDRLLERWVTVVTGPHREAMAAVLRERRGER